MFAVHWIAFVVGITTYPRLNAAYKQGFFNIDCNTYRSYVKTDAQLRYHPYVVQLHRCAGRDSGFSNLGCEPKTRQTVSVQVQDHGKFFDLSLENVTSCEEKCLLSDASCNEYQRFDQSECRCLCNIAYPPSTCLAPFRWDKSLCDCICPIDPSTQTCEKKMVFNKEFCKCKCKEKFEKRCRKQNKMVHPESCLCVDSVEAERSVNICQNKGVSEGVVIVICIAEFIIIVLLYLFLKKYCDNPIRIYRKYCPTKTTDAEDCKKGENPLVET